MNNSGSDGVGLSLVAVDKGRLRVLRRAVFRQSGKFAALTVPLSAFAGCHVVLRLMLDPAGGTNNDLTEIQGVSISGDDDAKRVVMDMDAFRRTARTGLVQGDWQAFLSLSRK